MLIAIIFLYLHQDEVVKDTDSIAIDWVKDIPAPQLRKLKMKPPLKAEVYKPENRLAREAKNKLAESSPNKITEVAKLSERIIVENVEVHEAPPSDNIPELMTDAKSTSRGSIEPESLGVTTWADRWQRHSYGTRTRTWTWNGSFPHRFVW